MEDIVGILLFRTVIRTVGHYTRYLFFRLFGRRRTFKSLSNESKDEYKDLGKALTQDFLNAVIGAIVLFIVILVIVSIVFS